MSDNHLYECPICKFASISGVPVRDNAGKVLKTFTDSKGIKYEPETAGECLIIDGV